MSRNKSITSLFTTVLFLFASQVFAQPIPAASFEKVPKPRVIVLTDVTNEPDDQESLVRFLVYANEYDVEGMIATTSTHLRGKVRKDKLVEAVNRYGQVRDNLLKHAPGFPTQAHLMNGVAEHLPLFGMEGVGPGKSSSGSQLIIKAVDRADDRHIWISVWGGANCLAQALWEVRQARSKAALDQFVAKLRVYSISDQDDAGRWMRLEFPGLFYVVSPSNNDWREYYRATWSGISGDRHYKNGPMHKFSLVDNPWLEQHVMKNHGPLGEFYPRLEYIMEGDTPSFLSLIDNGLGSSISPAYGGWGGRYVWYQSYAETHPIWTNSQDSRDEVVTEDGKIHVSDQATIWRWREAFQHDFAARMDWCVARTYAEANHNPVVALQGDKSKAIVRMTVAPEATVTADATGTTDPDGNAVSFNWFVYKEAGTYSGAVTLSASKTSSVRFIAPKVDKPVTIHLICEVRDNGTPNLFSYRRVIVTVDPALVVKP
ncbi:DUF1593 domain-containing protein [Nibrella saemangeumensis]|uniref:DUF1593 domain-containing protein n=1 Tax=Nibrella saemangeumensis TaxID=1084526 RepID=A0ABP8NNW6_9BACT